MAAACAGEAVGGVPSRGGPGGFAVVSVVEGRQPEPVRQVEAAQAPSGLSAMPRVPVP